MNLGFNRNSIPSDICPISIVDLKALPATGEQSHSLQQYTLYYHCFYRHFAGSLALPKPSDRSAEGGRSGGKVGEPLIRNLSRALSLTVRLSSRVAEVVARRELRNNLVVVRNRLTRWDCSVVEETDA
jgi:hypothetical protein